MGSPDPVWVGRGLSRPRLLAEEADLHVGLEVPGSPGAGGCEGLDGPDVDGFCGAKREPFAIGAEREVGYHALVSFEDVQLAAGRRRRVDGLNPDP